MKFFRDLVDVLQSAWNFLSGSLVLLSFVFIPVLFPAYGIYLIRRKKKIFGKVSGQPFLTASIIVLVVWIYFFLEGPTNQIIAGYARLLSSLAVLHLGVFLFLGEGRWKRFLGVVLVLVGLYGFVLLVLGRVYSGI